MCQAFWRRRCRRVSSRGRPLLRVTSVASPPVAQAISRRPRPWPTPTCTSHPCFHALAACRLPLAASRRLTPPSTSPHRSTHPYPCSFSSAGGRRRRRCGRPGDRGHRRTRRRGRRCLLVHQGAILTMAMLTMAMLTMAIPTMAILTMAVLTTAMLTMASSTGAARCGAWRRGKAVTPCAQAVTPLHPMHCTLCTRLCPYCI